MRWQNISENPNSGEALRYRADQLSGAWCDLRNATRREVILDECRGKVVLDVGAVDHFSDAMSSPTWLHREIAAAASSAVAIDADVAGVQRMNDEGFRAHYYKVGDSIHGIATLGPFDVVVAGELIEHLDCPLALFELARQLLRVHGRLVLSTPNPYAIWRVRAGQLRLTWENVDHVAYLFPSGVAELADRSGLRLLQISPVAYSAIEARRSIVRGLCASLKQFVKGSRAYRQDVFFFTPLEVLIHLARPRVARHETMIYVLERPPPS